MPNNDLESKSARILTIVAVPIGNVDDLSPRARAALEQADGIFCEDKRKVKDLAERSGLALGRANVIEALPGDSERERDWETFFSRHPGVNHWCLISDAGTPIVNDPGRALLTFWRKQGWKAIAIPGPSAPVAAWQWSGGFGLPFVFAGFAPKGKKSQLDEFFAPIAWTRTFCFFDTRHQWAHTLEHLVGAGFGDRACFAAREITKSHEQLHVGTVSSVGLELQKMLAEEDRLGELTLIIEGDGVAQTARALELDRLLQIRLGSPKSAAKIAADLSGASVKDIYDAFTRKKDAE